MARPPSGRDDVDLKEHRVQHRRAAAATLTTVVLAAGCGHHSAPHPAPTSTPASSPAAWTSYDPPTRFGAATTTLGPAQSSDVLLYAGMAYAAGDTATTVTDLLGARQLPALTPTRTPVPRPGGLGNPVGHRPALVQRDGRPVLAIPYAISVPAAGSSTASQAVQVLLADAATGQALPPLTVAVVPAEGGGDFTAVAGEYTTVIGAQGNTLVLTAGRQVTVGVDLTTGSVLWRNTQLQATAILGDTLLGLTAPDSSLREKVVGVGVADGATRWTAATVRDGELAAAGPGYAVLLAEQDNGKRFYALVHPDGTLSDRALGDYSAGLTCRYDQAAITVCSLGTTSVFALDATTGKLLWQLPATGRTAPTITAAWHGAVYGTADDRPLVLDARTGTDRETVPGLAPVAVSGYAGVASSPADPATMTAYPAAG